MTRNYDVWQSRFGGLCPPPSPAPSAPTVRAPCSDPAEEQIFCFSAKKMAKRGEKGGMLGGPASRVFDYMYWLKGVFGRQNI